MGDLLRSRRRRKAVAAARRLTIPGRVNDATLRLGGHEVALTNLNKPFWPDLGLTKRDLLQYYADVSPALLPHLKDRAMVMKRYPNGAYQPFFFMKRTPTPHPQWLKLCPIRHAAGNIIRFPMIQDVASLLWVINLGCIDLNQWYARCDDPNRPDYLHFDLDPVPGASFAAVRESALAVHESLDSLKMPNYAKTTGSRGIHIYVPIVRGPTQKQVWTFSKALGLSMAAQYPKLLTAVYATAKRPRGHVLVDYNQNAWGRTLASIYSVRPTHHAGVSTPLSWDELKRPVRIEDFRIDNVPARVQRIGDLWKPLLAARGRVKLERYL